MNEQSVSGRWLARVASWLVDPSDFERAVEPALADMHFEQAALRSEGRARAAAWLVPMALARVAFVVLPALVVRRRALRSLEARWALLVPALVAAALGTWAFREAAPSPAFVTLQLVFVGVGLALALAAGTTSKDGWLRFGPLWGLGALGALALALVGEGTGGARRWVKIGPLWVQTSLLFWPLFVVALAALVARKQAGRALALFAAGLLLLAAQRDPATALPWAVAACVTLYLTGASPLAMRVGSGIALLGVGLAFTFAVALPPLPHVEGVWGLLARQSAPGVLAALACAAAINVAPFAAVRGSTDRFVRGAAGGVGALLVGLFLRPLVADEPVPLLGYGGSGAIGVLLGLGLIAGLWGGARAKCEA
jgi:hypothetical protein